MENNITYISIDKLLPHPQNPRKQLGDLTELADSIKANGVYQNLTVVEDGHDTYKIIIGHRRHAAAKIAGLTQLPCVVTQMTMRQQLETMLLENMQRSDLTVIEEAQGLQLLIDLGDSVADIAASTGFSKNKIKSRLCLNCFEFKTVEKAFQKGATLEDFVKLNRIKDVKKRQEYAKYLGSSNFDYYVDKAIEAEKWRDSTRSEIISLLKQAGAKETKEYPRYETIKRSVKIYNAENAKKFIEENPDRDILYKIDDCWCDISIYALTNKEDRSTLFTEDPNRQKRHFLVEYINGIKNGLNGYIDNFIRNFSDRDYLSSTEDKDAESRTICLLIYMVYQTDIESHIAQHPRAKKALEVLGVKISDIGEDGCDKFFDIGFRLHENAPILPEIKNNPIKYLLALCRTIIDIDVVCRYESWHTDVRCAEFRECLLPVRFVSLLEVCGFQTPDELKAYLDGNHAIYSEEGCAKIIEDNFDEEDIE